MYEEISDRRLHKNVIHVGSDAEIMKYLCPTQYSAPMTSYDANYVGVAPRILLRMRTSERDFKLLAGNVNSQV